MTIAWKYDDGGRAAAGYATKVADCVVRATAIAEQVGYDYAINLLGGLPCFGRVRDTLEPLGWMWVDCGQQFTLDTWHPPDGRLIVLIPNHYLAVIQGRVHDNCDIAVRKDRSVVGYWMKPEPV